MGEAEKQYFDSMEGENPTYDFQNYYAMHMFVTDSLSFLRQKFDRQFVENVTERLHKKFVALFAVHNSRIKLENVKIELNDIEEEDAMMLVYTRDSEEIVLRIDAFLSKARIDDFFRKVGEDVRTGLKEIYEENQTRVQTTEILEEAESWDEVFSFDARTENYSELKRKIIEFFSGAELIDKEDLKDLIMELRDSPFGGVDLVIKRKEVELEGGKVRHKILLGSDDFAPILFVMSGIKGLDNKWKLEEIIKLFLTKHKHPNYADNIILSDDFIELYKGREIKEITDCLAKQGLEKEISTKVSTYVNEIIKDVKTSQFTLTLNLNKSDSRLEYALLDVDGDSVKEGFAKISALNLSEDVQETEKEMATLAVRLTDSPVQHIKHYLERFCKLKIETPFEPRDVYFVGEAIESFLEEIEDEGQIDLNDFSIEIAFILNADEFIMTIQSHITSEVYDISFLHGKKLAQEMKKGIYEISRVDAEEEKPEPEPEPEASMPPIGLEYEGIDKGHGFIQRTPLYFRLPEYHLSALKNFLNDCSYIHPDTKEAICLTFHKVLIQVDSTSLKLKLSYKDSDHYNGDIFMIEIDEHRFAFIDEEDFSENFLQALELAGYQLRKKAKAVETQEPAFVVAARLIGAKLTQQEEGNWKVEFEGNERAFTETELEGIFGGKSGQNEIKHALKEVFDPEYALGYKLHLFLKDFLNSFGENSNQKEEVRPPFGVKFEGDDDVYDFPIKASYLWFSKIYYMTLTRYKSLYKLINGKVVAEGCEKIVDVVE